MNFKKFSSIENSYRTKEIERIQTDFPREEFVVQEKVHGSNFSMWTDGTAVKCAKRSGFIKENESFFNYEVILDKYEAKIIELFHIIRNDFQVISELGIYGEIYGGRYPHPDVPKLSISSVQKGVAYSPDVEFIAFDIKLDGKYVDFNLFTQLCESGNIPYLPALLKGSLEECLDYPNDYQSTIPTRHELPAIEDNIVEGNVIRPINVLYHGNGNRVLLKNKNDKFKEKEKSKKEPKIPVEVPEHVKELLGKGLEYITENRLRNVLSKVGTVNNKQFGMLMGLFSKDVVEDFSKEEEAVGQLDNKDRKMLTKEINKECGNLIRSNFLNILDGNF